MMDCSCFGFWRRRLYAPLRTIQTPPLTRYHKYHETPQHEGVSFATACCIAINMVMGSGFLALPQAFASAGLVLGTAVLAITALTLRTTVMYEVEVMCRAEAWVKANLVPHVITNLRTARCDSEKEMHISTHAFQVVEMCELFGGRNLQLAYSIALFLYMFLTLWGFGAVFGSALATYAPVPILGATGAYCMYVLLFSFVVVPLSVLEIKEQAAFQSFLTGLRFLIMVLMVGSVLSSLWTGGEPFGEGTAEFVGTVPYVRWWGLFQTIPSVVYSLAMASASPTLVSALEHKNSVGAVIWATMISSAAMYGLISIATAYYFGASVHGSCNVNWEHYRPGGEGAEGVVAVLGRMLAYTVVLFPAIDVTSVYPLSVMVLANNMMAAIYHDHVDHAENDHVIITTFRIACGVPPLLCALLLRDFAAIVSYAGCFTVLIVLIFPAYLNLISKRMCEERFGNGKTPFTKAVLSSTPALYGFLGLGCILFVGLLAGDIATFIY